MGNFSPYDSHKLCQQLLTHSGISGEPGNTTGIIILEFNFQIRRSQPAFALFRPFHQAKILAGKIIASPGVFQFFRIGKPVEIE